MEARLRKEIQKSFVLRVDDIKKIWELVQTRIPTIAFSVSFNDSVEIILSSPVEISRVENSKNRKIETIEFSASSSDSGLIEFFNLRFSNKIYLPILLEIRGDEKAVRSLNDELLEIIEGLTPWYNPITKFSFIASLFVLLYGGSFLGILIVSIARLYWGYTKPSFTISLDAFLLIMFSSIILATFFEILKFSWFPMATFAIGQGKERHEIAEKFRWSVIIALIISCIGSLIVSQL